MLRMEKLIVALAMVAHLTCSVYVEEYAWHGMSDDEYRLRYNLILIQTPVFTSKFTNQINLRAKAETTNNEKSEQTE